MVLDALRKPWDIATPERIHHRSSGIFGSPGVYPHIFVCSCLFVPGSLTFGNVVGDFKTILGLIILGNASYCFSNIWVMPIWFLNIIFNFRYTMITSEDFSDPIRTLWTRSCGFVQPDLDNGQASIALSFWHQLQTDFPFNADFGKTFLVPLLCTAP